MNSAYILDILRTPIGKYAGSLSGVRPDDLMAGAICELLKRNPAIPADRIEDVIVGAANQAGEDNRNVARMALLLAGMPNTIAGVTVNRLCASGLQAIMNGAQGIQSGQGEIFIAGGVESMSRAPYVMAKPEEGFSRKAEMYDTTLGWRFTNKVLAKMYRPYSMGETAENVAAKWAISREEQDRFSLQSQEKFALAETGGKFAEERIAVSVPRGIETIVFNKDEYPRQTTMEKLAALKPAFKDGGTVTAGNSSGINDGAAAAFLADEKFVKESGVKPLARVVAMAVAGVDPAYMGIGPVPATLKALARAGLKISEIGLIELNEAFASQSLACIRDLNIDPDRVNVNGGAISIGHPLGCSGVRISATLIHEMQKRKVTYGLATMCVGVGQGAAVIYERC